MLKVRLMAVTIAVLLLFAVPSQTTAQDITSLIKIFGVGYVVKQFAGPLNDFVNNLLNNRGVAVRQQTKVVPILTIGIGQPGFIGAAQVSGPKNAVEKVQAVGQLEADFSQAFRIKALVPLDSLNPIKDGIRRVPGVGITAIIDLRI